MIRVMDEAVVVYSGSIDMPHEVKEGNTSYLSNTNERHKIVHLPGEHSQYT
jgi:hypothetical protein